MSDEFEYERLETENHNEADHVLESAITPKQGTFSMLKVMKRDGTFVDFDRSKIETALLNCYMDPKVYGPNVDNVQSIRARIAEMSKIVSDQLEKTLRPSIDIEEIQDLVEQALMDAKEYKAAREYIQFRAHRTAERPTVSSEARVIHYTKKNGERKQLAERSIMRLCHEAAEGLPNVDAEAVKTSILKMLYDGVKEEEIGEAMTMSACTFIEVDPEYSKMAARLLLSRLRRQVFSKLDITEDNSQRALQVIYGSVLKAALEHGIKIGMLNPELVDGRFDLEVLGKALETNYRNDFDFDYHGLKTLYDRYFLHDRKVRYELPQVFLMRVAMGIALKEDNPTQRALEFYNLLSFRDFMSSTPTLFNSGTRRPQLSSCFLTQIPDDLLGIYKSLSDNAMLSKFAGGLGNDWTPVRGVGSLIKGTNGESNGTIPFMKVFNDTAVAVNQGGKRKGAVCAYLETWHRDIEAFLELRKNTGDEHRRTHDMNTANWVPDLFMERVAEKGQWTLFSPEEVPELHDLYGNEFRAKYEEYEAKADRGEINVWKRVQALDLWRKMLSMIFETGHPWVTFKDPCNIRSPQQHCGVVHSSNLCTEITLNTKAGEEVAVCNLGSVNLPAHVDSNGKIMYEKLRNTVRLGIRMLDNVIDNNFYTVEEARVANKRHRPIGLGVMGFQHVLYKLRIPYASAESANIADQISEAISYFAIEASAELAQERGAYESFDGSLWSKGILPLDSLKAVEQHRKPEHCNFNYDVSGDFDWEVLRDKVKKGMRNSNTMAIAPTATISDIVGVSQSIEPMFENLHVRTTMSGDFTTINTYLVNDLKAEGLWDQAMRHDLKYYDGSVQSIERIPSHLKELYRTCYDIPPTFLIQAAARRQKWIDQAQSLNLYMREAKGSKIQAAYEEAWLSGLKTTYYFRTQGATSIEKTSIDSRQLNQVSTTQTSEVVVNSQPALCRIDDPDCEACQ